MYPLFLYLYLFDSPLPYRQGFQDSGTFIATGLTLMHDQIVYYLILVLFLVIWLLIWILYQFKSGSNFNIKRTLVVKGSIDGKLIELVWTISPALILLLIAIPSYKLLYIMDLIIDPVLTVKAIGRQWYWEFEYWFNVDFDVQNENDKVIEPNSYSRQVNLVSYGLTDQPIGGLQMANADTPLILPIDNQIRLFTTSGDVIHSLAVPTLALKGDGIPGRLNGLSLLINRSGSFYGQCSELCGINHPFMPINIVGVDINNFITWYTNFEFN